MNRSLLYVLLHSEWACTCLLFDQSYDDITLEKGVLIFMGKSYKERLQTRLRDDFVLLSTGYLYKLYDGELKEYKGEVGYNERYNSLVSKGTRGRGKFMVYDEDGLLDKMFVVPLNAAEVYNNIVWLRESDKFVAALILGTYEHRQIERLEAELIEHRKYRDQLTAVANGLLKETGEETGGNSDEN